MVLDLHVQVQRHVRAVGAVAALVQALVAARDLHGSPAVLLLAAPLGDPLAPRHQLVHPVHGLPQLLDAARQLLGHLLREAVAERPLAHFLQVVDAGIELQRRGGEVRVVDHGVHHLQLELVQAGHKVLGVADLLGDQRRVLGVVAATVRHVRQLQPRRGLLRDRVVAGLLLHFEYLY